MCLLKNACFVNGGSSLEAQEASTDGKGKHLGAITSLCVQCLSDPFPLSLPTQCFFGKGGNTIKRKKIQRKKRKYRRNFFLSWVLHAL